MSSTPISITSPESSTPTKPKDPNIVYIEWMNWTAIGEEITYVEYPIATTTLITRDDNFYIDDKNVKEIARLANLESLSTSFSADSFDMLTPLKNLTKLKEICLYDFAFGDKEQYDFSFLNKLTNLELISIMGGLPSKIPDLSNLKKLTSLDLDGRGVQDISNLSSLTNLTELSLEGTIKDISPLSNLTHLTILYLEGNNIKDISPLSNLRNLQELSLEGNSDIKDLSPLENLTNLEYLNIQGIELNDVEPLLALTNLKECQLSFDKISDENLAKLRSAWPNCKIHQFGFSS